MKKLCTVIFVLASYAFAYASGHTITITKTNATCNGTCNGTAAAVVSGATGPVSYDWTPGNPTGDGTANVTSLCSGTYTLTVIDSSDMSSATGTVTISQPAVLNVVTTGPGIVCMGQGAVLNSSVSGGTAPYTYNWLPATNLTDPHIANPFCNGLFTTTTFTLTVTDAHGCIVSSSPTTLTVLPPIIVTLNPVNPTCGTCNGSISAVPSGGAGPYTYSWTPAGITTAMATGLCAGAYTVTVVDGMGCMSTASQSLYSVSSITNIYTTANSATCGNSDGSATVDSTAGGTGPFTYSWNTVPVQATATATGLSVGTYSVTVQDASGCSLTTAVTITNLGGPSSAAITTVPTSCLSSTGEINIGVVTGGTPPYTYALDGGAFSATVHYTGLPAGAHSFAVKDGNGCLYLTTITINTNTPVITLGSLMNAACTGGTPGSISINVTGGAPAYTYAWSNGVITQNVSGVTAGAYSVVVTGADGCASSETYHISNNTSVYTASLTTTPASCGALGTASITAGGGTGPYTYLWNSVPVQATPVATALTGGYYNCTIQDVNGCTTTGYVMISSSCLNTIRGNIYNDANTNCVKDGGETGLGGRVVTATPGYYYGYTDANGNYTIQTPNMNNTVTVSSYALSYLSPTCPATGSMTVNFSSPGDTLNNNDFGYYSDPAYFNLVLHPGWSSANPGFQKHYWICYYNASPTPQNVLIRFVYDSVLQYTGCTQGGVQDSAQHKIEWTFSGVPSSTIWDWATKPEIYFNVPSTLSTSANLHSYFEILPISGDAYPADNTLTAIEPVTGSHDPNSKAVMPQGIGTAGEISTNDSVLMYTIHFQNNGNDTAHFVVVKDTLSAFLDPATVIPGAASHPYTFEMSGQGVMTFSFNNIMLPDSLTDEPASNGYFNYTVRQKPNNPAGTVINNTAGIYFDYNLPVITNTTVNTLVDLTTGITSYSTNAAVSVYPNPFTDNTTFVVQSDKLNETYSFEMTDVLGKRVRSVRNISEKQFSVSRNGLETGMYFYKIYSAEKVIGVGKVIIK